MADRSWGLTRLSGHNLRHPVPGLRTDLPEVLVDATFHINNLSYRYENKRAQMRQGSQCCLVGASTIDLPLFPASACPSGCNQLAPLYVLACTASMYVPDWSGNGEGANGNVWDGPPSLLSSCPSVGADPVFDCRVFAARKFGSRELMSKACTMVWTDS